MLRYAPSGTLSTTPSPEAAMFGQQYVAALRKNMGKPYGEKQGQLNCVTHAMKPIKGSLGDDRKSFLNGGTILRKLQENGESFSVLSSRQLASESLGPGTLVLRLEPAINAAELRKFFKAGDLAIWQDKNGNCTLVPGNTDEEQQAAYSHLSKKGEGTLFLTRHYLPVGIGADGPTFIHASSSPSKRKVVEEKAEDYLSGKTGQKSSYVVVDLAMAYPKILEAFPKEKTTSDFFIAKSSP